jgi:hypothetical protein
VVCRNPAPAGDSHLRWATQTLVPLTWEVGRKVDGTCCVISLGGLSNSSKPLSAEGKGVWRCLTVERLSQVELHAGKWHTESRSARQTCIDEIDFDIDAQPGGDPQKGQ